MKNTTKKDQIWLPEDKIIQFALAVKDGLYQANLTGLKSWINFTRSEISVKRKK